MLAPSIRYGALLMLATPALAEPLPDTQQWTVLQVIAPLSGPLIVAAEITVRAGDAANGVYQIEPQIALGIRAAPSFILQAGYGNILNRSDTGPDTSEARFHQQATLGISNFAGGAAASRLRLEERIVTNGDDTGYRLRLQFRYLRPFAAKGKTSLVVSHESFLNLNDTDWGIDSGYGEARNFIGLRRSVAPNFDLEGGYLNQYQIRKDARDRMNHTLALTFAFVF